MKKTFFTLLFFAAVSGYAQAQSSANQVKGANPDPNAPVNVSEPALRPANPAQYSANELPQGQKGQFYVKDDKPADAAGNLMAPEAPRPNKLDVMKGSASGSPMLNQTPKAKAQVKKTAAKKANK